MTLASPMEGGKRSCKIQLFGFLIKKSEKYGFWIGKNVNPNKTNYQKLIIQKTFYINKTFKENIMHGHYS